jgi:hypothetical protein
VGVSFIEGLNPAEYQRKRCSDLLRKAAEGQITGEGALKEWPRDAEGEPLFGDSWHVPYHFAADADIRDRDTGYAEYQKTLFLRTAGELT